MSSNRYPTERFKEEWRGHKLYIDVAYRPGDGSIWSIFISGSKDGTELGLYQMGAGISLSKLLRLGQSVEDLLKVYPEDGIEAFVLNIAKKDLT